MIEEDQIGRVETDKAAVVSRVQERFDSGFASGGSTISSLGSPQHHKQQQQPTSKIDVSRQYTTQDSGICERFNSINLTEQPELLDSSSPQKQQHNLPLEKILEYYDADADGDCQLHLAVADGVSEVVLALIRMAPNPSFLDIQNNELYAPLHIAVLVKQPQMVRQLVVAGAATDIRDKEGNTPLHLAAKRGFKECAAALLSPISTDELREAGVSHHAHTNLHAVLNLKNYNGEHCVHLATFGKHYEFLAFLNFQQADMNATEGRSGKTALHYAVNMRDEQMVRMLVAGREQGGCGVWLNARDWAGRTAIQCAQINGDLNIQNFLGGLPGVDTTSLAADDSDEDFEFDTDEDIEFNDIEVNGMIVEASA